MFGGGGVIVSAIVRKKIYTNLCLILNGYHGYRDRGV